jgi:hypothetical protein
VAGALAAPTAALAHATYNISGYGAGIPGSTNGADGSPTSESADPPATWTNGPAEGYAGALPVHWYSGMHAPAQARSLQTGLPPAPPSGSLLAQVTAYNDANDPDLPADRVLAVGGKSWADPENGGQGWGHGLDFGLLHFSPVEEVLADGPVKFTVTVADDPTDGVSVQLAFALYGGWDATTTAVRHQTFVTSPSPEDAPLGATGLELVDFAVAGSPGQTLTRSYTLDAAYGGEYTLFVGAQGGVAGQYVVSVSTTPDEALGVCEDDLATATSDVDEDGVGDAADDCPATPAEVAVDATGCSLDEFCAGFEGTTKAAAKACNKADWDNDESVMGKKDTDCHFDKKLKLCLPAL